MCGIAGAIRAIRPRADSRADSRADTQNAQQPAHYSQKLVDTVIAVRDAESHRGPDGFGLWQSPEQEVIFAHRRLAIIDLSEGGAQPKIDPVNQNAVTFNGEIYNYLELKAELLRLGHVFTSSSDTEVVLKAYAQWGLDGFAKMRGIFALALWDAQKRIVHLVRDQMGIKPLYWSVIKHTNDDGSEEEVVLFASEVRALLASGYIPRRLNANAVASYLWQGFIIGPDTIVENIHLLPAAHTLSFAFHDDGTWGSHAQSRTQSSTKLRNEHTLRRYWRLPNSWDRKTSVQDLRKTLDDTVRMQLIADVPLGVFLSGGVDSSAVAALASDVAPEAVHTFTIGFDVAEYDETRYAAQVAKAIGSQHKTITLTEQMFQEQLPDAFTAIDQPTFDAINTYFVSRAARNAGMTVALAGTGGDELFGGYRSFVDIPKAMQAGTLLPFSDESGPIKKTFNQAVRLSDGVLGALAWNVLNVAPPQTRWGKVGDVARASHDLLGLYQVSYGLFTESTQEALAGEVIHLAQSRQKYGLPPAVAQEWHKRIQGSEVRHAVSTLEMSSFIGERLLRDTDTASMAVALEVRVPLLDHVLVETVAGLDPERRFSPARQKKLLRDVALSKIDPAVFDRPKSGFVLPIDTWARQRLMPMMDAVFANTELARRVGLNGKAVKTLWRSFVEGKPGLYWSRVWSLYVLMSWCQTHNVYLD